MSNLSYNNILSGSYLSSRRNHRTLTQLGVLFSELLLMVCAEKGHSDLTLFCGKIGKIVEKKAVGESRSLSLGFLTTLLANLFQNKKL